MLFSLIVVILLLAIAFFQSTQGLFSSLIMAVLCLCCSALAVGGYEWLAVNYLAPFWQPDYSFALALAVLFGIPLIIFRLAADKLVRRSCHIHGLFDRIGGGFCGLITGYTVAGMLTLAVQSIPFGGSVFGFERVPRTPLQVKWDIDVVPPPADSQERNIWMNPDRFVVGLASILSSGIFSGERSFGNENPDHVQHIGWINAVPEMVSRYAPPGSIAIVKTEQIESVYTVTPSGRSTPTSYDDKDGQPRSDHKFYMIRVSLKREARGEAPSHIFTLRQFRLVGRTAGKGAMQQYHAIAVQQADKTEVINRHIRYKVNLGKNFALVDEPFEPRSDNNAEVEVVFELPTGFVPAYLEYKHGARVAVTLRKGEDEDDSASTGTQTNDERVASANSATSQPSERPSTSDESPPKRSRRSPENKTVADSGRGGNVRGVTTLVGKSFFGSALPLELKDYQDLNNLSTRRRKMTNGHLSADVDAQAEGTDRPIKEFDVPRDKRLLQLNTTRLHARSGLGKALARAGQVVQNYFVEDDNGNRATMIGKYAIATVNDKRIIEVQYFPDQAGTIGGLGQFRTIKDRHLKKDYELVLLFLVEPGATITAFSSGSSATRRDDLRSENLVAPD
ncbi:MAG: CvpA family protein [Planctomycetes bacterium]|nr:CvpA family protein [Planctomycetota bacterium]